MAEAAIDNDVLFKAVCYGLSSPLIAAMPHGAHAPGLLGTARFVLPKLLRKRPPRRFAEAQVELEQALQTLEMLEPTEEESALAAQLEFDAQRQALPVHGGECLLVAMMLLRNLRWLLTGDRAAIEGLSQLAFPSELSPARLDGRIACLEQAVRRLLIAQDPVAVREAICAECKVDTSLRVCFSCSSPEVGLASWYEGLESRIQHLRDRSGKLLMTDD